MISSKTIIGFSAKLTILVTVLGLFHSCSKITDEPDTIPKITLIEATTVKHHDETFRDSIIRLVVQYEDGDGDIGIREDDTLSLPDFHVQFFQIKNGSELPFIIPLTTDTLHFNQRLPYVTPSGKNKFVKGNITLRIPSTPYPEFKPDSVRFYIQLFDRKRNSSNIVFTPPIIIKH